MANTIAKRSVKLLRKHRGEIATRCDLWFEEIRTMLAEAFRTDMGLDAPRDLAVLEDRVLLSATPMVEAVELTVTQTADVVNGDTDAVEDLVTNDGGDGVSLREAILAANEESDPVTITLGPGTYVLEIGGVDDNAKRGDLDLNGNINIRGAGAGVTIIDASGIMGGDRVFHARNGASISIEGVTVTGGRGKEGAGILVDEGTSLALSDVVISGNHSSGKNGGGISNQEGMIELTDVTIADNSADNKEGGGILNYGIAILNRVTVSGNHAKDGAGIYTEGSDARLTLTNVTISGNHASDKGGGIYAKEQVEILHSTIAFNTAETGGGIEEAGATVSLKNSILAQNFHLDGITNSNVEGTVTSLGHNIDSDGTASLSGPGDQANVDPSLSRNLSFNGGKTQTHALMYPSVAINVAGSTGSPAVDQRNMSRDANPDVGAFEFIPNNNAAPTVADNSPTTNENTLHMLFSEGAEVDFGNLNAAQAQGGNASIHETATDTGFETEESASEEANNPSAEAETRSDDDSDMVASVEAAAMQAAQSAVNKIQIANGSSPLMPADSWGGEDAKGRNNIEKRELSFENRIAIPAAVADIDRDTHDTIEDAFRSGGPSSQLVNSAQRAIVQPQLWQAIESMNDEVNQSIATIPLKIGATATTTAGLTAGYVVWVLRSGLLMSTAFAHLPMWRFMDPLAILDSKGTYDEDGESLQTIVANEDSADGQDQHEPIAMRASADV